MTKVADTRVAPNIALPDPRQRCQKLSIRGGLVIKIEDHSSFKFMKQINQLLARQVHLS